MFTRCSIGRPGVAAAGCLTASDSGLDVDSGAGVSTTNPGRNAAFDGNEADHIDLLSGAVKRRADSKLAALARALVTLPPFCQPR